MRRRDFLKATGTFFATATLAGLPGCGDNNVFIPPGTFAFPQGVASGDPRATSVVLWTRVVSADGDVDVEPISLVAEVATDLGFQNVVVSQEITATADSDFAVRLVVDKLAPGTSYHYRF